MAGSIQMAGLPGETNITITNLEALEITKNSCKIKFKISDYSSKFPIYITYNMKRKEISNDMVNKISYFEYTIEDLKPNTYYGIYLSTDSYLSSVLNIKTEKVKVYGVRVDESNSDPEKCVTYIEDAIGISPATPTNLGGWSNVSPFNKIRLVGFDNGQVVKEINPNNKLKYLDGTDVPTNTDLDIMVEIPKFYWDFKTVDSNVYELRISEDRFNDTCDCYAHKVCGIEKDYIYVGAYLGLVGSSGRLRSLPNKTPTVNKTLTAFRTAAKAKGNGYQQFNWFTMLLLQNLYLIAYKNLNSQTALGMGVCNGSKTNTGGTNTKGMIFGSSNKTQQICFLGIEDFYGNLSQWVDGMKTDGSYNVLVTSDNKNFNDNVSGFKNVGKFISNYDSARISKVAHTNEGGFFPKEFSGSYTTYYCDYGCALSGYFAGFGGDWDEDLGVGVFYLRMSYSASHSNSALGSRLCYLGDELQISISSIGVAGDNVKFNIHSDDKLTELYVTKPDNKTTIDIPIDKNKKIYRLNDEEKFIFNADSAGEYTITARSEKETTTLTINVFPKPSGGSGGSRSGVEIA